MKAKGIMVPVAGGKGGTGKSVISVNLALVQARAGMKTLLADLDLGASNLHTMLGQKNLRPGVGRMMVEKGLNLADLIYPTPWPHLAYLPGDNQVPQAAGIHAAQRGKVIRGLRAADFDLVISDLGAGTSLTVLDFFLTSPRSVVVFTPELTSLLNAYALLRQALFRALSVILRDNHYAVQVLADYQASPLGTGGWTVERLKEELARRAPGQEERVGRFLRWWRPGLILNQVRREAEVKMLAQLAHLARQKLSLAPILVGLAPYDPSVPASINARRPALDLAPASPFAQAMTEMAEGVVSWRDLPIDYLAHKARTWTQT